MTTSIVSPIPSQERKAETPVPEQAAQVLEQAARFTDDQWLQNLFAVDSHGQEVHAINPAAIRRCAVGHLTKAIADTGYYDREARIFHALRDSMAAPEPLSHWNDQPGRTPEEVRQLFRAAARSLRNKEPSRQHRPDPNPEARDLHPQYPGAINRHACLHPQGNAAQRRTAGTGRRVRRP